MNNIESLLGKVTCKDCLEFMRELPDSCVDIIITSPPYNLGINYASHNDNMSYDNYIEWQKNIHTESKRILKDTGRLIINIPFDTKCEASERHPIYSDFIKIVPLTYRTTIYWNNGNVSNRIAWGSFQSASAPHISIPGESIIVFHKGDWKRDHAGTSTMTKKEFIDWTIGDWRFGAERNRNHPAPFPIELPSRCLKMFSYKEDIVFDPFMGSGTTAVAAEQLGRRFIGCDMEQSYVDMANKRVIDEINKRGLFYK